MQVQDLSLPTLVLYGRTLEIQPRLYLPDAIRGQRHPEERRTERVGEVGCILCHRHVVNEGLAVRGRVEGFDQCAGSRIVDEGSSGTATSNEQPSLLIHFHTVNDVAPIGTAFEKDLGLLWSFSDVGAVDSAALTAADEKVFRGRVIGHALGERLIARQLERPVRRPPARGGLFCLGLLRRGLTGCRSFARGRFFRGRRSRSVSFSGFLTRAASGKRQAESGKDEKQSKCPPLPTYGVGAVAHISRARSGKLFSFGHDRAPSVLVF